MENKNWKDTLHMPKTDFDMKAGLTTKEPIYRKRWEDEKIYAKSLEKNKGNKPFILHDGPPYANGSLHVGHALNKILKDVIVRRKHMEGFYSPFVAGWDTHGLPIENKMLQEMGMSKDDLDPVQLRKEAAKYALSQVEIQKNQFKSMQLFAPLDEKYVTLEKEFEASQLELFKKMALDGLIYKGLKPVFWSPSSQSALAEAEVEYKDHMSPQVIVAFSVSKGNETIKEGTNLLIMTTTPWTLIANSGVAVGEDFYYDVIDVNGTEYVVASLLAQSVANLLKWEEFKITRTVKGSNLVGLEYNRPIKRDKVAPVIAGHHVTTDAGTGLVHIAPLFGEDDYTIGKEHNLEMIMHVDGKGNFNSEAGEYEGKFYSEANKEIGMFLDSKGELLSLKFLKHSYPHDWRTHKPVIFRGVPQWFVNIKSIKDDILKALECVKSYPSWGVDRIAKMIEQRSEWTISRQRTWGVPIIVFYDKDETPVIKEDIFNYVINLVKEHGTDVWWERETDELLPVTYRGLGYTREMDIMDVWFDSGSSSIAVKPGGFEGPFDIYLEGSDQYRGWFNSSLINSVAYRNVAPFKELISHGFVLDGKQQKMSKSKGNVIDPLKVINTNGADILRLWAANSEYSSDVSISDDILKQNIEIYRRIRNTFKFMLGNLNGFDIRNDKVELKGIHKYIYGQVNNFIINANENFATYKFIDVIKDTNKLLIDLSGWYFEYAKDVLYCESSNNNDRRSIQTNIYFIVDSLSKLLAPFIPTTMEEVYSLFDKSEKQESIFLERLSEVTPIELEDKYKDFMVSQRDESNKILEDARKQRVIKRNNEAILTINVAPEKRVANEAQYAQFLMVAKVEFGDAFKIRTFESDKCQRCWNHFAPEELTSEHICSRCNKVVNN